MNILILSTLAPSYQVRRLQEELAKRGHSHNLLYYRDLYLEITTGHFAIKNTQGIDFSQVDYIIPRTPHKLMKTLYYLTLQQNSYNKHILNEEAILEQKGTYNKLIQYVELAQEDIPLIPTLYPGFGQYIEEITSSTMPLEFPLVVKDISGSKGKSVHIAHTLDELQGYMANYKRGNILVQKIVDARFDLRVIVIGGEVLGAMKRTSSTEDFRNNYSLGGTIENFELTDEIRDIARKCAQKLRLDYCGIDLINDNGQYKVLEVNIYPQFQGFEEATGVNIASKLIDFIENQQ
jgi:ribosomal protein S6--L-glutamate ligase